MSSSNVEGPDSERYHLYEDVYIRPWLLSDTREDIYIYVLGREGVKSITLPLCCVCFALFVFVFCLFFTFLTSQLETPQGLGHVLTFNIIHSNINPTVS